MFADGAPVGLRTYPVAAGVTLLGLIVRIVGLTLVFPAILVTLWLGVSSLPLLLLFAVLIIEARAGGSITVAGRKIRFEKQGGIASIVYTVVGLGTFLVSALVVLNIQLFQQLLDTTIQFLPTGAVILVVIVVGRSLLSLFSSSVDERPEPVETFQYAEITSSDVNQRITAFNQTLPDGVPRVSKVESGLRTSGLQHALIGEESTEQFRERVSELDDVGVAAKNLDAVFSVALGHHYDSPLAEEERRAGVTEE